jgi:hypothetical protein
MTMSTKISRTAALDAARAGGQAFRDGKSPADCPHGAGDAGDRFLAHYWMRGFRAAAETQPAT